MGTHNNSSNNLEPIFCMITRTVEQGSALLQTAKMDYLMVYTLGLSSI